METKAVSFFDFEINPETKKTLDIGSIRTDDTSFHENNLQKFFAFIDNSEFICGHNIFLHDLNYISLKAEEITTLQRKAIDTLFLSPLLFPSRPYHNLLKDDKLQTDELSNPINDSKKARDLFYDEVAAFHKLDDKLKKIYFNLLEDQNEFSVFFRYVQYAEKINKAELTDLIFQYFKDHICQRCNLDNLFENPVALAYSIALIESRDKHSITPPWVLKNFPKVEQVIFLLRNNPCVEGCNYCNQALNSVAGLKRFFGFEEFRSYEGEPLQKNAVNAAIKNESLLAVFPTGGGKSITFQVPALMSGENSKALTVIISPLQSLMKDQVDNLEKRGITDAVTINGLLDPIERSKAIERVYEGSAHLLYIAPESLRSVTIERLLLGRKIARFVIDEAHCFSSWGQDFRVDYLYIGDFIKNLQEKKRLDQNIPVSCFTATAKQKVIEDIRSYFKTKLNIDLTLFHTKVARKNLHYVVYHKDNEEDKYNHLRNILEINDSPAIVYVSRTRKANKLSQRLSADGFNAKAYHGKMEVKEKTKNQNDFINGQTDIMVATSAFGMGVDKSDVGKVIHYDISDSLENYVQEAGRAGRDENISAECYVLFNEEDLDKHFILLNQTKISIKEIQQIWKAIKELTKYRERASNSALEIARKAGWDESIKDIETRVTTAIAALEDANYLKRGQNMPRIYATSIQTKTAQEAIDKISSSSKFEEEQKVKAIRIIKKLFSSKNRISSEGETPESRIDYISDQLGIVKSDVLQIINLLREEKILADNKDLSAFIKKGESSNKSLTILKSYASLEKFFLSFLKEEEDAYHIKEINEFAEQEGVANSDPNKLKTLINFWAIKNWIKKHNSEHSKNHVHIKCCHTKDVLKEKMLKRHTLSEWIVNYLYQKSRAQTTTGDKNEDVLIQFSVQELKELFEKSQGLFSVQVSVNDIEDTLFFLSRIEAIKIEGGFLVVYNKLTIDRLEKNNRIQYKDADYEKLSQFYQSKVQQIHIVGEYAKRMIRNYQDALQFVDDYFTLNYSSFLNKYFPGSRQDEIKRTMTPAKFQQLFGTLSPSQLKIIKDSQNQYIIVAAGPGSGKTRVLVHKLASLLLTEDIKHEQLLMLTFSRAAATEFKKRLLDIIGNAANYIDIKTFHSYCFDLMGKIGSVSKSDSIIQEAVRKIGNSEIELSHITRTVLVIDEAQDMNADEFSLVQVLMKHNEEIRVILVGDDDQNIYQFRKADSKFMQQLITENGAAKYELTENYRSKNNIVDFSNQWSAKLQNRLKSQEIVSVEQQAGNIKITQYSSTHLIVPTVGEIRATDLSGSTCILTKTNEEAALITGLLLKYNIPAKLIQSNENFHLNNIVELRYFSDQILAGDLPIINDGDWSTALQNFRNQFRRSTKFELILTVIDQFELANPARKYKSDWKVFLNESRIEDFISVDGETIYVSTIHKAKGKEFDNVFILLDNFQWNTEEAKRQFYVAITRAKNNLCIHYNGDYLREIKTENLVYKIDNASYSTPIEQTLILTHFDVKLGYFEYVQHRIKELYAGDNLNVVEEGLANGKKELVAKFSRSFQQELDIQKSKGYILKSVSVNFIVYWKNKEEKEIKIILPQLILEKLSNK
jgi:ATP-dependent DNA helicase RecQ